MNKNQNKCWNNYKTYKDMVNYSKAKNNKR